MKCQFCESTLGKADLGANTCQSCGDVLDHTQIEQLRSHLNIEAYQPPVVVPPLNKDAPLKPPESEQCPSCFADLMGDDLQAWQAGAACPFCGTESLYSVTGRSTSQAVDSTPDHGHPTRSFIVNSGSSVGEVIDLPLGIEFGRRLLRNLLPDPEYQGLLSTVSSEHLRLHSLDDGVIGVEDLGSRNGTYINGATVVGPVPTPLSVGDALCLHHLSVTLIPPPSRAVKCSHQQSGVSWSMPLHENASQVHFGRMTDDGRRSPWYLMAQLAFANDRSKIEALDSVSRRHLFVEFKMVETGCEMRFWHEEGKEPCELHILSPETERPTVESSTSLKQSIQRVLPLGTVIEVRMRNNTFAMRLED